MRSPVFDGVALDVPFDRAVEAFRAHPRSWLPEPAQDEGERTVVVMHASGLLSPVGVQALIEVGEHIDEPPGLAVRPIAWRALRADRAFPRLVGELELAATTERTCRLTLVGGYKPPVSVLGDAGDRLVGRHVADAVIRQFLESVAARLTVAVRSLAAPQ
jgi:hypothetical protein